MHDFLVSRAAELRRRLLLITIAGVPLLILPNTYDPINVPKLSLLMAGVSLAAALRIAEVGVGVDPRSLKRLMVPALALSGALIFGWLLSPYKGWALLGPYPRFTGLLPYLVAIVFGVLVADAFAGRAREVGWALLVAGGVAGVYALIQFVGLDPFSWSVKEAEARVISSTLGNPNFAGAFLAIVLPLGVGMWLTDPAGRRWSGALTGITFLGLVATSSQVAWAAGLAGVSIVAGAALVRRWSTAPRAAIAVVGVVLVTVIGAIALSAVAGPSELVPDTVERRAEWWKAATSMFVDSPMTGRGPGAFAVDHSRYRTLEDARQVGFDITDDPHSLFLSLLTGGGVVGGLAYVIAMGWLVRYGLRVRDVVFPAAFFGAVVAYMTQSLASVDTVALRASFWAVAAGLVTSTLPLERAGRTRSKSRRRPGPESPAPGKTLPFLIAGGAIAVVGVWWTMGSLFSDIRFQSGQIAIDEGDFDRGSADTERAIGFRGDYFFRREYGRDLHRLAMALAEAGEDEAAQRFFQKARETLAFTEDFPHSNSVVDHARLLSDWSRFGGDTRDAVAQYERAAELDPMNPVLLEEASAFSLSSSAFEATVEILDRSVALIDSATLWGRLGLAQAWLGDESGAQTSIDKALGLDPQQAEALEAQDVLSDN